MSIRRPHHPIRAALGAAVLVIVGLAALAAFPFTSDPVLTLLLPGLGLGAMGFAGGLVLGPHARAERRARRRGPAAWRHAVSE